MAADRPLDWARNYRSADLVPDILAGLTIAALLIPQSMAYAGVGGFPAVVGLYASVAPLIVYALLGGSPVFAIGPLISINVAVGTGVARVAEPSSAEFVSLAATVAVMMAVALVVVWITGVGRYAARISRAALDGFLLGVAITIVVSQLDNLLGLPDNHLDLVATLGAVVEDAGDAKVLGVIVGVATFALVYGMRRYSRFPAALTAVVVGSALAWWLDWGVDEIDLLGTVPSGLPTPELPPLEHMIALLPTALVGTLLVALQMNANEHRFGTRETAPSHEFGAFAAANAASAIFRGMPVSVVPSRTAVAVEAGVRSQLGGLVAGLATLAVLLVGTAALAYLPLPVLAGVAMVAAILLARPAGWRVLWRTDRRGAYVGLAVAVVAVAFGLEIGALAVVVASFVDRSAKPADTVANP